jgi:conserved oligomeric Golgi complex subunit 2
VTPFTPFTAYPNQKGNDPQSYFFFSDENTRLPLLDDGESQLATLYNNILQFVEKNCVEVMEIATRVIRKHGRNAALPSGASPTPTAAGANDSRGGFDIMANVVWADIGRALMDELGALIFAAGKPVEFKAVGYPIFTGINN